MIAKVPLVCALAVLASGQAPKPDPWEPLRFLEGSWTGESNGQPGVGQSQRSYEFALGGKFLMVRNKSVYAAQAKNPNGEVHEDWGMIGYDKARKRFVLRQFHTEGFVNQYVQESPAVENRLVFVSEAIENIPPGWRARETYTLTGRDEFVELFELAAPGKDFEPYSENRLKRASGSKPSK